MTSGTWCSRCGRPASLIGPSLDPDHPLVFCAWVTPEGFPRGHGRVPGILDSAELGQVMEWQKIRAQARAHALHFRDRLVAGCPVCQQLREAHLAY